MKILEVKDLEIEGIKSIEYARFPDNRGYFTETWRESQFKEFDFLKDVNFQQANESHSKYGVIRGLHFQWNPYMGKLIRVINGRMIDIYVDIRKGSPTLGYIGMHSLFARPYLSENKWIWVPPGFAHGCFFTEDTTIEYFCSGEWSPNTEAAILCVDNNFLNWSLCDPQLKKQYDILVECGDAIISDKDKQAYKLEHWLEHPDSDNFQYSELK